jgi:predicted ATPase
MPAYFRADWHATPDAIPLVGRERDRAVLTGQLELMLQGHGRLVLIGGEAGIGKTALVQDFVRAADKHGVLILAGHCYDLTATPPYGPWVEIARHYRPDGDLPPLHDVFRPGTGMGNVADQADLFEVARSFLMSVADAKPLVVVLEDLHWSDPASLDLLRYLGRHLRGYRMLIIATYRDDEVTRRHPLFQLLPVLVRESHAERITLRSISQSDLDTLLECNYDLDEDDRMRLSSYLQRFGEGNPLYVREILRTLEDGGQLVKHGSSWSLGDLSGLQVPNLLTQLIERRLLKLDNTQRELLEAAAVVGQQVSVDLWAESSAASRADISAAAERAIAANVLDERPGGTSLAFGHALVREALYQGIPLPRRQLLHVAVAEALLELSDPDPDAVAYHIARAGDDRATDWLLRAGERANRTYAWKTAAQRFGEASDLLRNKESRLRERGWLLYRTARLLRFSDHSRAIQLMDEAELIGRQVSDPALVAYSVADRGQIRIDAGDYRRGLADMQHGNDALDGLPDEFHASAETRNWGADVARFADAFPNATTSEIAKA